MRPLMYDVFCGGGGATRGYQEAGFRVIGIDNRSQPHYCGDGFVLMDAFEFFKRYLTGEYKEAIAFHASPPCQRYSECTPMAYRKNHPDLIGKTRDALQATGRPFVIENVENARALLENPVLLCGSMFGLGVWRHRYFEVSSLTILVPPCNHSNRPTLITGTTRRAPRNGGRFEYSAEQCREASGLDWMTRKEMDEAIPPAYTFFIGTHLMEHLKVTL